MKYKLATTLLVVAGLVVATFSAATTTARPARAADGTFYVDKCPPGGSATKPPCDGDSVILKWDEQLLSTIRAYPGRTGPTITARALGVLHTATYDAWAAYEPTAKGTRLDGPMQQTSGNTLPNKEAAISYAAARVLNDLFPVPSTCPSPQTNPPTPFCPIPPNPDTNPPTPGYKTPDMFLTGLGYPVNTTPASLTDTAASPAGVGNLAAKAVLDFRRGKKPRVLSDPNPYGDGSNQLGDQPGTPLPQAPYKDYTGYTPDNEWDSEFKDVTIDWKWQRLCVPLSSASATGCTGTVQTALHPQWGKVITFSGLGPSQFKYMVPGPPKTSSSSYSNADVATALADTDLSSAVDGDLKKTKAEYWADGPGTEFPPGHTAVFAQALSRKKFMNSLDSNAKLDHDAKLFFMVGNAMMDTSIAAWWLKYEYDFWRPITAIRHLYKDQTVTSWLGPGANPSTRNFGPVQGKNWMPYQALGVVTPAFPEYVSGHSTFTGGGASLLALFNGSDTFGASVKILQGSSKIDTNTPAGDVTLSWPTFSHASNEAGWSRRYGGIHFYSGDMHGRAVGRQVAQYVYSKAQSYIKGSIGK